MSNAWTPFYWSDHIGATGHLTLSQHGAYLLLIGHYYVTGRPLPANASILHRVCRCTTEADKTAVNEVLAEFFVRDGEVYRHRRIDRELGKAVEISEKRRRAALVKHQKDRANAPAQAHASAYASAVHMDTQPQPQPQLQIQEQDQNLSSKPESGFDLVPGNDFAGLRTKRNGHAVSLPVANELETALREVWDYYVATLSKNATLYRFDDDRKRKGLARLRECCDLAREPKLQNAIAMLKVCIDRLAASDFHQGKNDQGKKYTDWSDHLFPSKKKLMWWLDDDNHTYRHRERSANRAELAVTQ